MKSILERVSYKIILNILWKVNYLAIMQFFFSPDLNPQEFLKKNLTFQVIFL